ncbi:MAG: hypothetical protein MPW14_22440 [Candidatus Manganitrophus sp.]|nr:MAG: hypothetical protein MPW14_22440 [Candidatus Manganitrophus sp.]
MGGGDSAFTTTNGAVTSVGNGSTTLSIAGGDLDFATGNYIGGGSTGSGFQNVYAAGGSVSITGNIGSGSVLLMQGDFANNSTFNCCTGSSPVYASSFGGLLDISYLDADLAAALGFNLPASGGSLAQVEIFFGTSPTASGVAFSGTQGEERSAFRKCRSRAVSCFSDLVWPVSQSGAVRSWRSSDNIF